MHHTNVSTMFSDPCNPNEFTTDCHHGYCEVQESGVPHCHCFDGWVDQGQQKCNKKEATTAGPDPTTAKPDPTTVKPDPTTPPAPGPCNSITCQAHGNFQCQHCTGECILDENGDEQCACDQGWTGNKCEDEE